LAFLEVDSADAGQFDLADADFLAGFAGLLGIAIERSMPTPSSKGPCSTRPC
jgi:GAF domain-containing protein